MSQVWHNHGVMKVCEGGLKGSTEYVLEVSLCKILLLDGVMFDSKLNFELPLDWIPVKMYKTAAKIIDDAVRRMPYIGDVSIMHQACISLYQSGIWHSTDYCIRYVSGVYQVCIRGVNHVCIDHESGMCNQCVVCI